MLFDLAGCRVLEGANGGHVDAVGGDVMECAGLAGGDNRGSCCGKEHIKRRVSRGAQVLRGFGIAAKVGGQALDLVNVEDRVSLGEGD